MPPLSHFGAAKPCGGPSLSIWAVSVNSGESAFTRIFRRQQPNPAAAKPVATRADAPIPGSSTPFGLLVELDRRPVSRYCADTPTGSGVSAQYGEGSARVERVAAVALMLRRSTCSKGRPGRSRDLEILRLQVPMCPATRRIVHTPGWQILWQTLTSARGVEVAVSWRLVAKSRHRSG